MDQYGLSVDDGLEQGEVGIRFIAAAGILPFDDVIGQPCHGVQVVSRSEKLEGADPHEAPGGAGNDAAGQQFLPGDLLARRHGSQCACGRYAECCHGLADQVFTQHRPQCGTPSPPREKAVRPEPFRWMSC